MPAMSKLAGVRIPASANVPNSHCTRPSFRCVQKLAPSCWKPHERQLEGD
jgi:hypothetical protein